MRKILTTIEQVQSAVGPGQPLALSLVPGVGVAMAWPHGRAQIHADDPVAVVDQLCNSNPRWVWWSARETAEHLVARGIRPRSCWDLGAVGRLLHGLSREDAGAVWAAQNALPEPPVGVGELTLLDLAGENHTPVRLDGHLSREWLRGTWAQDLDKAQQWASLALRLQQMQESSIRALADSRALPGSPTLPYLTALSESMAALLCVELEHDGLAVDRLILEDMLTSAVGPRPRDDRAEAATRLARDHRVWDLFPGDRVDLRNPSNIRDLLLRVGIDVPDTRSWRLEGYVKSSPSVAALLAWRKSERIATTYGWSWVDRNVGDDDRLRGSWGAAEGAGRMTASAGLHNLPAELRPAISPPAERMLVRADLGQVEPRVLAAISGDPGLAIAAGEDDMYAPVASALGSDRPTAKIAMLAAMYGQTSGAAGAALADMDRAYPTAMAYLRMAEESGRMGVDLRTFGGRLLPLSRLTLALADAGRDSTVAHSYGRFARNAVVQGAAAELFKAWAGTVRAGIAHMDARIVLCLHDELLVEAAQEDCARVVRVLDQSLRSTASWWSRGSTVRFVADVSTARSWAQAH